MDETTKNFIEVFSNLPPWELPTVLYRLYYDDQGRPIEYSHEDRPGNYIDVTPEILRDAPQNVRVINGELRFIDTNLATKKLVPSSDTGVCCDPNDVCVVVSITDPHIKWASKQFNQII